MRALHGSLTTAPLVLLLLACAAPALSEADPERPVTGHALIMTGPYAGTYDTDSARGTCTGGTVTDGSVAVSFSLDSLPEGVSFRQSSFHADKLSDARHGTSDFRFNALIAGERGGTDAHLDPPHGDGTGKATVWGDYPAFIVRVRGRTAEGAGVDVTLSCAPER